MLICPITGALRRWATVWPRDLVDVAATTDKPVFVVWGSPVGDEDAYQDILLESGVPVFRTFAQRGHGGPRLLRLPLVPRPVPLAVHPPRAPPSARRRPGADHPAGGSRALGARVEAGAGRLRDTDHRDVLVTSEKEAVRGEVIGLART